MRLLAFVIHSDSRRKGYGKKLLKASENYALKRDCVALTMNSGNRDERSGAHHFYLDNGYEMKSLGFTKILK